MKYRYLKNVVLTFLCFTFLVMVVGQAHGKIEVPKKTILIALDADWPPWSWHEGGKYRGFDVDVLGSIMEMFGVKYEYKALPWETSVTAVIQGKLDILAGSLDITCERLDKFEFSSPTYTDVRVIVLPKDSKKNAISGMCCGAKVATLAGSSWYQWIEDELLAKKANITLKGYENLMLAAKDLEAGMIDSIFSGQRFIQELIQKGYKIEIRAELFPTRKNIVQDAYGITKGDPHGLVPIINEGLKKLYESGKWEELYNKYFPGTQVLKVPTERQLVCE